MTRLLYEQFRGVAADSRFPFADSANLTTSTGQTVPNGIFVDALVYLASASPPRLREIVVTEDTVTLWIGDATNVRLASGSCPLRQDGDTIFNMATPAGLSAGVIVAETTPFQQFAGWPLGSHVLSPSAGVFVVAAFDAFAAAGVAAIEAAGKTESGDVWLVGDRGVVFRSDPDVPNSVRVDIVGDPLFRRALCSPKDLFVTPRLLRTINGCPGDANGNVQISVGATPYDSVLRIYPSADGLHFEAVGPIALTT